MTPVLYLSIQPDGNHIRVVDEEMSKIFSSMEAIMQNATDESILRYIDEDAALLPENTHVIVREGGSFFTWNKVRQMLVPFDPRKDIEDVVTWEFAFVDYIHTPWSKKDQLSGALLSSHAISIQKIASRQWLDEGYVDLGKNKTFIEAFLRGDHAAKRIVDSSMEGLLFSELQRAINKKKAEEAVKEAVKKDKDIKDPGDMDIDIPVTVKNQIVGQKKKALFKQISPSPTNYAFSILRFLRLLWEELGEEEPLTILSELALE